MKKFTFIFFILLLSFCFGCENIFFDRKPDENPKALFENMWTTIDQKYSFFQYKDIDWDAIRLQYNPLIQDDMSDDELFNVLGDMLNELQDWHVNLNSRTDISQYEGINRNEDENGFFTRFEQDFYDPNILEEQYFIQTNQADEDIKVANGFLHKIFTRTINGNTEKIGYLRFSSFSLLLDTKAFDEVSLRFRQENVKGVILDLRNNGGGFLSSAQNLAASIIQREDSDVAYSIYKSGPAHDDFTSPVAISITQRDTNNLFNFPVALLLNRNSYSASSFFAAFMRAPGFEHVRSFGNNTGGGSGLPSDYQLANGWNYRFSATRTYSPYINPSDIFIGEDQFITNSGSPLSHPNGGFDFEAGVPVEFPVSSEQFERYREEQLDYLMESTMRLLINNSTVEWQSLPKGSSIDFDL
ncbi:S41 family peptidase [Algivirga pacifica]|uniref:S41 family peptidase n=1 Tax=Algivirga pacifica TaxID=1162670 RepID=A0ABP9DA35_9BACT